MSNKVSSLVYSKMTGSMARKGILGYMADKASDDGSGIWCSKQTIAAEVECSKQTVITTMRGLVIDGLIEEVGQRKARNGYTIEYRIVLAVVRKLPDAKGDGDVAGKAKGPKLDRSNTLTAKGQMALPKPSLNPPLEEAEASSAPQGAETIAAAPRSKGLKGRAKGWTVPPITSLPPEVQAIARQWSAGAYETYGAGHAAHLAGKRRVGDPDSTWHARIIDLGDQPLRAAKGGLRFDISSAAAPVAPIASPAACDPIGEGAAATALRQALRDTGGEAVYQQWLAPCRYDIGDEQLTVTAPSNFLGSYVRSHFGHRIEAQAQRLIGAHATVGWEVQLPA